ARDRLEAWKGRIDKLAADTQAMGERFQNVRVTVDDRNGLAQVTVDSTGAMVDQRLTDRIHRVPPDEVARAILATLGQARGELADRSQEIITDTVGDSPAARAIAERVGNQLRGSESARVVPQDEDDGNDSRYLPQGAVTMTFQVDVEQLRALAANVAEIQARFAAVKAASAHITQDGQAYGVLCEWISGVLEGRHTEQDELIAYQEETLGIVVKTLLVSSD
ncbi:hypothetical protein J7S33_07075, partial [Saccharothrix algeriensis]